MVAHVAMSSLNLLALQSGSELLQQVRLALQAIDDGVWRMCVLRGGDFLEAVAGRSMGGTLRALPGEGRRGQGPRAVLRGRLKSGA